MTIIDGIAEVIRACGFHAMANEFVNEPDKRGRIIVAMHRNILREFGPDKAREFNRLLDASQFKKAHFR